MRMGNLGQMGEYGPFAEPGKGEITFGIFDKNVSGTLIGKEITAFTMKASRTAKRYPKAEEKLTKWAEANGLDANNYKVMVIMM